MTRRLLLALAACATLGAACEPRSAEPQTAAPDSTGLDDLFETDRLTIINDEGEEHRFDVYIAEEWAQQRRGLMFVRDLPETSGMLFVYPRPGVRSMWMKNTYIPLDIVFLRADGSVSSIIRDTVPMSLESQSAVEPVSFVLELNAGVTRRLNIGEQSRMTREAD